MLLHIANGQAWFRYYSALSSSLVLNLANGCDPVYNAVNGADLAFEKGTSTLFIPNSGAALNVLYSFLEQVHLRLFRFVTSLSLVS